MEYGHARIHTRRFLLPWPSLNIQVKRRYVSSTMKRDDTERKMKTASFLWQLMNRHTPQRRPVATPDQEDGARRRITAPDHEGRSLLFPQNSIKNPVRNINGFRALAWRLPPEQQLAIRGNTSPPTPYREKTVVIAYSSGYRTRESRRALCHDAP